MTGYFETCQFALVFSALGWLCLEIESFEPDEC